MFNNMVMSGPTFSPDGNWMWNGTEWIPAPPKEQVLPQSSIDEVEVSNVAAESGVDPEQLTQVAPYFDENKDQILQQSELQQAAMSISNDPNVPAPQQPVVPHQPVAPMAPAVPQQPVAPMAPVVPQQPAAPMAPAVPQQPAAPMASALATSSSGKGKMIVAISLVLVLILGSLFYLWNDNSGDEDEEKEPLPEFVGKWASTDIEGFWIEFKSDGTVCDDEEGCSGEWEIAEDNLIKVTNGSDWTYLMKWNVSDGELYLNYTSVKDSDGVEQLDGDNWSGSFVPIQSHSEVVGTWTFCSNAVTEECDDYDHLPYNVTFNHNGTFVHPAYPGVLTTYAIDDDSMEWNIGESLSFSGQFEIEGDVMYIAFDKIIDNNGNVSNTTLVANQAIKSESLMQEGETSENWNMIVTNNSEPSWFTDYVEFGKGTLAGDSSGGSLVTYQFEIRDAAGSISSAGMDDLVYVKMTQGDSLSWALVGISIAVDGGPSQQCVEQTENSTADCTYTTSGEDWSVPNEIMISEGENDFCGDVAYCEFVVSVTNNYEGKLLGEVSGVAE